MKLLLPLCTLAMLSLLSGCMLTPNYRYSGGQDGYYYGQTPSVSSNTILYGGVSGYYGNPWYSPWGYSGYYRYYGAPVYYSHRDHRRHRHGHRSEHNRRHRHGHRSDDNRRHQRHQRRPHHRNNNRAPAPRQRSHISTSRPSTPPRIRHPHRPRQIIFPPTERNKRHSHPVQH